MIFPRRLAHAALLAAGACTGPSEGPGRIQGVDLQALYDGGQSFPVFLSEAEDRRDTWQANYTGGVIPDSTLRRGRALPGRWRLLVVAEDWCGDSANTVPYAARLAEALEGLEMRVIRSRAGRPLMEAFLTPDGRAATPTMVLLDTAGTVSGCFVEQPPPLQEWWLGPAQEIEDADARFQEKYDWYAADAGASTVAEIVRLMEAAATGGVACVNGSLPGGA